MTAARPIPEGMTVLRLGQYGRPSLATAGLLVNFDIRAIWRSGLCALKVYTHIALEHCLVETVGIDGDAVAVSVDGHGH